MAQSDGLPEFATMLNIWIDEARPLIDGFQALFPQTAEGELKYLLTIHMMIMQVCEMKDVPPERFHDLVPTLLATWFKHGKPERFDYGGTIHIDTKHPN